MTKTEKLVALTHAVRGTFNRLKMLTEQLHSDIEITTAMRAVMETLSNSGAMTVPQIAKAKGVTRQHIQLLADALCEVGLASVKENPAHKRSSLITLTEKGKRAFAKMSAREAPVIAEIAQAFGTDELDRAADILERLSGHLDEVLAGRMV